MTRGFSTVIFLFVASGTSIGCDAQKAKIAAQQINVFRQGLEQYYQDWHDYPDTLDDLTTTRYGRNGRPSGPYVVIQPIDPWGKKYIYHRPTTSGTSVDVLSAGPDGQEGDSDNVRP